MKIFSFGIVSRKESLVELTVLQRRSEAAKAFEAKS